MKLCWLRRDLRTRDNPALYYSSKDKEGLAAVYLLDQQAEEAHGTSESQLDLIHRSLNCLAKDLEQWNIPLIYRRVERNTDIPVVLEGLLLDLKARELHANREYPLDEQRRDRAVKDYLEQRGMDFTIHNDGVLLPPEDILNGQGAPYRVYTPFYRCLERKIHRQGLATLPFPLPQPRIPAKLPVSHGFPQYNVAAAIQEDWPAGETAAWEKQQNFFQHNLESYQTRRDIPAEDGTSRMSAYYSLGVLSARQSYSESLEAPLGAAAGASAWRNELGWRDFYRHLMVHYPDLSKNRPFHRWTEAVAWRTDDEAFQRWTAGETGIPLVDAAMKQLNHTGWMHNRLRMITASFLTKNLLIHWQRGQDYFMSKLIDGDFASNNGGWQWSASTGADGSPWFRVFNPVTQGERYDPQGNFIGRFIPELRNVPAKQIHGPGYGDLKPLVDLKNSRKRAIEAFKSARAIAESQA